MQQDVAFWNSNVPSKPKAENVMFVNQSYTEKNGKSNLMRTSEKPLESMRKRKELQVHPGIT